MLINLSDVLSDNHNDIDLQVHVDLKEFEIGQKVFQVLNNPSLSVFIQYAGEGKVDVKGETCLEFMIPCDRCLSEVKEIIPVHIDRRLDTNEIDGYSLDINELIMDELVVGWPTKILCKDDCKGISWDNPDADLDPRMSVIRDIFKNCKEV
ncbi:uncharacterized protein M2454_001512 [Aequitasia blattaphilus]|uniref:DUF177 domain-containing protein n=1 Tax=Aequitasia blattaphilus TaxID=2949332 RepID=A0ABT1E741_9FIRM|nr:DUF177 domain-containing protein [Aequitasia blattaphilus]MCP1101653.1 DUF177 domain-containing protein [Aequitasia blattaphilus]MCR8614293.1 DUF177 domain-containing protein [Aequitasia blattaphilus]